MVASTPQLENGRFYTAGPVADLALSVALGDRWPPRRLLDPTCGNGAFLQAASMRGLASECLHGSDNDPVAIAAARLRLPDVDLVVRDLFDPFEQRGEGWDAVVGNPPYVRSERLGAENKQRLATQLGSVLEDAGLAEALIGRGDLAACALARAVGLLAPGGRLGFVVSAALLEADYAAPLWRWLATVGAVRALISAPAERWFADAAVNTLILVFERGAEPGPVQLVRLNRPTQEAAERVKAHSDLGQVADIRLDESGDPRRWAMGLRSPPLWLELETQIASMVPLGELADVRRGLTSGANDIFYFTHARAEAEGIEPELLVPLVRAPSRTRETSITIEPDELADWLLVAPTSAVSLARYPRAKAYLEARADAAGRPTMRNRSPWWALPSSPAQLFLTKAYARRFVQRYSETPLECDQRVYAVRPESVSAELLAAVLNGSLTALTIEALGRASMGEGALEWTVADARRLPIIDPHRWSRTQVGAILAAFRQLRRRPIGPAEDEVGRADRLGLDLALAAGDPILYARTPQIAEAVARAAIAREARARSVIEPGG